MAGLSWHDARQIAAAVAFDITQHDEAASVIRNRARETLAGSDGMTWQDPEGALRALDIAAAMVIDQL